MSRRFRFIMASLLAATPALATAQEATIARAPVSAPRPSAAALAVLVDSVVGATLLSQGVPSASVVVTRGGETLVQRAWGRADVASGRAADPSTVYAIGSNTKQFTAALVLRLVERGRLTLGDSIGNHLSGLRPEWGAITIEQLLNHTSGLQRSYVNPVRIAESLPGDSLIAQAARDTMASRPGTAFLYSNTGYLVLGVLVEKLYGKPYAAALRDEIARPLGLATLRSCGEVTAGGRATGYNRAFDGTLSSPVAFHPSQQLGAGGICSTAADLAKWNQALHGGRVLSEASYRAMTTPRGAAVAPGYGFGLSVAPAPWGGPAITHGGQDVGGFVSEHGWYPADSLSVTILYNVYPRAAAGATHVIAALALGHTPPATPAPAGARHRRDAGHRHRRRGSAPAVRGRVRAGSALGLQGRFPGGRLRPHHARGREEPAGARRGGDLRGRERRFRHHHHLPGRRGGPGRRVPGAGGGQPRPAPAEGPVTADE